MGKRNPVWIDGHRSRTAADLTTVEDCDVYTERALRDAQHIIDDLELPAGIPRNPKKLLALKELPLEIPQDPRNALFKRKLALIQLRDRKRELLAQSTPSQ